MRHHMLAAAFALSMPAAVTADAGPAGLGPDAVVASAATPRPEVPLRSDVYTGKYDAPRVSAGQRVPRGYRPVWDDGRLNPHRGPRTAAGDVAMQQLWTDAVPMELVSSGR